MSDPSAIGLNDWRDDQIVAGYRANPSLKALAKEFNLSVGNINRILVKRRVKAGKDLFSTGTTVRNTAGKGLLFCNHRASDLPRRRGGWDGRRRFGP